MFIEEKKDYLDWKRISGTCCSFIKIDSEKNLILQQFGRYLFLEEFLGTIQCIREKFNLIDDDCNDNLVVVPRIGRSNCVNFRLYKKEIVTLIDSKRIEVFKPIENLYITMYKKIPPNIWHLPHLIKIIESEEFKLIEMIHGKFDIEKKKLLDVKFV